MHFYRISQKESFFCSYPYKKCVKLEVKVIFAIFVRIMRKGVRITIIVLAVLLCAGAAAVRVLSAVQARSFSERRAALSQRLDSLGEAMTLLRGMDSLYRVRMHQEPVAAPVDSLRPEKATRADSLLADADSLSLQLRESTVLSAQALERARFTPSICPLKEGTFILSARFGTRTDPLEGDSRMHDGLDLACPQGNPVHVTADGVVSFIDSDIFGYGNCIIVDHGFGYQTRYAHLSVIRTSENIKLKRGDVIGETGVSGRATGPHLHYEVIYNGETVDPEDYIEPRL